MVESMRTQKKRGTSADGKALSPSRCGGSHLAEGAKEKCMFNALFTKTDEYARLAQALGGPGACALFGIPGAGRALVYAALARALAVSWFGSEKALLKFDMSEYQEQHTTARLLGAPPGYLGHDEGGQLTEAVRRRPYSVVLFDEVEKAHPDVLNILLQILDDGRITDAQGRVVNFENTIIIMTSNAGSDRRDGSVGFGRTLSEQSREKAMKALGEFLRPEFIGRVDEIVVFNDLTPENLEQISNLMLTELVEPLRDKGIAFSWDESVPKLIASMSEGGLRGARDLRNNIRRQVEDKIANAIVDHASSPLSEVRALVEDGKIVIDAK